MTKADLVERVAKAVGPRLSKKECGMVVEAFLASVQETLVRGEGIEIRGFGTFKVRHRKARKARNPRTGEPVEVPPRKTPVFQPSRLFLGRMNRLPRSPEEAGGSQGGPERSAAWTMVPVRPARRRYHQPRPRGLTAADVP